MIQGKLLSYKDDLNDVYKIRNTVFVEELGIPKELEFNSTDKEAIHALVYEVSSEKSNSNLKTPVATGKITFDGEKCTISNIAVLKDYRNKQYGDFTVRVLINKAFTAGINEVTVYAYENTVKFFENIGFKVIEKNIIKYNDTLCKMEIKANDVITICKKCKG